MCTRLALCLFVSLLLLAHSSAQAPEKPKPDVGFVPTPQPVVEAMLEMARVAKQDLVYDLGCGDGRLVILAAKQYGARGVGIDIDPARIAEARQHAAAAKVEEKVEFREADIFQSDFKDASVITLYLLNELNVRLRPQIYGQVKPGTRIVSHAFRMGDWQPDVERTVPVHSSEYNVYFWTVPANMSGRWKTTRRGVKGLPETVLIEQKFQMLTVREKEDGEVLGEGRVNGNEFTISLKTPAAEKPISLAGRLTGNSVSASGGEKREQWKAEREAGTEKPLVPAT